MEKGERLILKANGHLPVRKSVLSFIFVGSEKVQLGQVPWEMGRLAL